MGTWRVGETVELTNGSTTVTGTGTNWGTAAPIVYPGYELVDATGVRYEIATRPDDTTIELVENYAGATGPQTVNIIPISRAGIEATINRFFQTLLEIGDVGRTIHTVSGAPDVVLGKDGDFAIDPTALLFYSKSAGAWSAGTSMVGSGSAKDFVIDFGADPTEAADSDDAWTAAVAAAADGALISVPNGRYRFTSNKLVSGVNGLFFEGESVDAGGAEGGVIFRFSTTTGDCVTFDNCQHSGLKNIRFKPTVRRTSGYDVKFTGKSFMCNIFDCRHEYGWNAVHVLTATDCEVHRCVARNMYGNEVFKMGGGATFADKSFRCTFQNVRGDNPYTNSVEAAQVKSHSDTTGYLLGDIVRVNAKFWECTTAGTSGAGTSPSTPGGTTAAEGFSTEVTDGTVGWTFRGHHELIWLRHDSYSDSCLMNDCAFLNGWIGFYMSDTVGAASNASIPQIVRANGLECDHNFLFGILLNNGRDARFIAAWVSSMLDGNGIVVSSSFVDDFHFIAPRSFGCAEHGILIDATGCENWSVSNAYASANSQKTPAGFHGLTLGGNVEGGIITGCHTSPENGGSNPQGYGIFANSGVDNCIITNNKFTGNTTGSATGLVDSATLPFNNNLL